MTSEEEASSNKNSNISAKNIAALFSEEDKDDNGEWFRDKVRAIFEHFDTDKDEHLKFDELASLQKATADTMLTEDMYVMACRALDCTPQKGISLDALKLTYAAEGSDIEHDYYKIFPERDPKKAGKVETKQQKDDADDDTEKVYEVGADGTVDIS